MKIKSELIITNEHGFKSVESCEKDYGNSCKPSIFQIFRLAENIARRYYSQKDITKELESMVNTSKYVEESQCTR